MPIFKKLLLYFNTVKYLKFNQIFYRVYYALIKKNPKFIRIEKNIIISSPKYWISQSLYDNKKISKSLEANFLNKRVKLDLPDDWNNEGLGKLWVYNLHYFDFLSSNYVEHSNEFCINFINRWIEDNPPSLNIGWDPYPTSLRIVNIIKAYFGGLKLDKKIINSLYIQSIHLKKNKEKHLLGNHYFVNLKALLFAGVAFKEKSWIKEVEKELLIQIDEQILNDGAHFELSPMYHSLMLVDMLDIFNLCVAFPEMVSDQLESLVKKHISKMLTFMETMSHPNGGLSFFNDSVDGVAPTKVKIESYAKKSGFKINPINTKKYYTIDNISSGYFCSVADRTKLIFDASAVGPNYIPGHAHADTLSFELSIGVQRVFVNSGTSEYALSNKRYNQRKTRYHNTVEVDGKDSSQVWSSFRVANRAKIISRNSELNNDHGIVLYGSHNGYKSLLGGCIHSRQLTFNEDSLFVRDYLDGSFEYARSHFYFHPDLIVNLENDLFTVKGAEFILADK